MATVVQDWTAKIPYVQWEIIHVDKDSIFHIIDKYPIGWYISILRIFKLSS
jgi:hypothetical protein